MIGALRTRVKIYSVLSTPDGRGGAVETTALWGSPWADMRLLAPSRNAAFGRAQTQRQHKGVIRFRDGFPSAARLVWNGRQFRVIAADDPDNRRERLHLICEEITP